MLETDEVDDDYFTPIVSTSLANIFGNPSRNDDETGNKSLKYTPPSEQSVSRPTSNVNECIFASAMFVYEWTENDYSAKGKIGFAIIHVKKNNSYDIVLYSSDKVIISNTTVSSSLEITVKGNIYISYYDNLHKYWSICATAEAMQEVIEILEKLNVTIKYSPNIDGGPPEPYIFENEKYDATNKPGKEDQESDTDSSLNRRTKDSILNRMANMGQSVLPRHAVCADKTSDSSDNNETSSHSKTVRHKPLKNIVKRVNSHAPETHNFVETCHKQIIPTNSGNAVNTFPLYACVNGQLVPLEDTNRVACSSTINLCDFKVNEMIISEQRISNSELRINVGKLSDRVDQILDKVKDRDKSNIASNFQIEILQKLITEYENKIKAYEQIITSKKMASDNTATLNLPEFLNSNSSEIELCRNKVSKLEQVIVEKNKEITKLNNDVKSMTEKYFQISEQNSKNEVDLLKEIKDLKHSLLLQQKEFVSIASNSKNNTLTNISDNKTSEVAIKLKTVMNETFRAISINFENDKSYSGDNIKSMIAAVIKQVTIDTIAFS